MLPECVGPEVEKAVSAMKDGDVCLLENLRFHEAETIPDKKAAADKSLYERKHAFAQQIANLGDVYVNDAFGTCHRDNASMLTVPQKMAGKPRVVGYLVQKELRFLGEALANPRRPFVCVLGGAKVSDKLGVIRALLGKCDSILIGGAMAYTFLAADGINVGDSKTEPDLFATARELRALAGKKLNLPQDSVAAERAVADAPTQTCVGTIPTGWMGLDIGSKTVTVFSSAIANAGTVFWNGPMGMFEIPPFDTGTRAIAEALSSATDAGAVTVVGGGDSAAAIDQAGLENRITHISTGGGASLEFLEGKRFAAIDILDDA
jgi:phosphoglycerate kinase